MRDKRLCQVDLWDCIGWQQGLLKQCLGQDPKVCHGASESGSCPEMNSHLLGVHSGDSCTLLGYLLAFQDVWLSTVENGMLEQAGAKAIVCLVHQNIWGQPGMGHHTKQIWTYRPPDQKGWKPLP